MNYKVVKWVCIALLILGFLAVVSDAVVLLGGTMGAQYALNISYFLLCPILIGGSGWVEYLETLK